MPDLNQFKDYALQSGYTPEDVDSFLGSVSGSSDDPSQAGYDASGKTIGQVFAETGRQADLDKMAQQGLDPNEAFSTIVQPQVARNEDPVSQPLMPEPALASAPITSPAPMSSGPEPGVEPVQEAPSVNPEVMDMYKQFAVSQGQKPEEVDQFISGLNQAQSEATPEMANNAVMEGEQQTILGGAAPVTQKFGNYNPGVEVTANGVNYGTDIAVKKGTPVAAPAGNWKVVQAYNGAQVEGPRNAQRMANQGYGNSVLIQNADTGEKMRFSHLGVGDVYVKPGQEIKGGTVFGKTGASGNTAGQTGQHLDLEYYDQKGRHADVEKTPYWKQIMPQ